MVAMLNRMQFLRGVGGAAVAVPFLTSLVERRARAQGAHGSGLAPTAGDVHSLRVCGLRQGNNEHTRVVWLVLRVRAGNGLVVPCDRHRVIVLSTWRCTDVRVWA